MIEKVDKKNKKVVVGCSGGKDSTAAIVLLKNQGYDVHALTMLMGLKGEKEKIEKIRHLTTVLDVPFTTVDVGEVFKKKVVDYFTDAYARGVTPNPCVMCNIEIKFNVLMNEALQKEGADFYATGHYAKKIEIDGSYFLKEPEDKKKSQIYFLSMIGSRALEKVLFPIAEVSITDVREIVKDLPLAHKQESQDVCFLHDLKLEDFLREHLPARYFREGDILDVSGDTIGRHRGAVYFTIGQRRGTGFASDRKLYVVSKDVANNTITLGDAEHLYSDRVEILKPVYWRPLAVGEVFKAKFRYMSRFYDAEIVEASADRLQAVFREPVQALTAGQVGAFYDNDIIVASGFIK